MGLNLIGGHGAGHVLLLEHLVDPLELAIGLMDTPLLKQELDLLNFLALRFVDHLLAFGRSLAEHWF